MDCTGEQITWGSTGDRHQANEDGNEPICNRLVRPPRNRVFRAAPLMKACTSEAELPEARFLKEEPRLIVQVVQEFNEGHFGGHRCWCTTIPTASVRRRSSMPRRSVSRSLPWPHRSDRIDDRGGHHALPAFDGQSGPKDPQVDLGNRRIYAQRCLCIKLHNSLFESDPRRLFDGEASPYAISE
jgi:hypothetical protein